MVLKFTYNQATPGGLATTIIITNRLTNPHSAVNCLMLIIDFIVSMGVCRQGRDFRVKSQRLQK